MAYMTGLIGTIQQLETANATPDPQIWSDSLSGLGTGETDQSYNGGNLTSYMGGIVLKDDGSTMLIGSMSGTLDDFIIQYDLGTAFTIDSNVTVSSSSSQNLDVNPPQALIGGLSVADGGSKVYSFGRSTNEVNRFDLSTAWDLSTGGSAQSNFDTSSQISLVYDGHMKDDGTKMYVVGYNPDNVYEYTLSTAHDLSTASLANTFDISAKVTVCGGIHFESNGYAFVVADASSDKLHKYNLSTAWDVSTATFDSSSDSLASNAATLSGVWFDDDWTYIYYTDQGNDDIFRINPAATPAQVTGLAASPSSTTQISLTWTAVSGATSYKVERSTSSGSGFSQIATPSSNSYNDTGRSAGTRYYYRVRATNSNGDGSYSSEANTFTLPNQVTGLSATAASSEQINLSWNNPTGTEAGYKIERSTSSGSGYSQIATTTSTSYSSTGLSASTTYYYRVRAYTSPGGDGAYSSVANATTQGSSTPPTGVSIRATSSSSNNTLTAEQLNTDGSGNNPVDDLLVSDWASAAATMTLNYGPTYSATLNNNGGRLEVKMYGYIQATGATSYAWDVSGATVDADQNNAISSISISGTASTSQNATSSGIGENVIVNHASGGRGYQLLASGDSIHWDIDATATNSDGSTSATQLELTLESS